MNRFTSYIGGQFGNPQGFMGKIVCLIMNIINRPMYIKTASALRLNENSKLLDIGYGNGYLLNLIYKKYKCNLYGIDISDDMMTLAKKRNSQAMAEGRLKLSVGDCCNIGYKSDFFDAVTSINTVYFWADMVKGLQEIRRCLKSGGCFFNVVYTKEWLDKLEYTKDFKKYSPAELVQAGYNAGFSRVAVRDIVNGKSFVVVYKK